MEATLVKHYPRQAHTQITVVGNGAAGTYPGRTTDVKLWATLGGHYLEVNQYATPEAEEPKMHELLFFPTNVSVEAVEDVAATGGSGAPAGLPADNGETVQDAAPKDSEGGDAAALAAVAPVGGIQ